MVVGPTATLYLADYGADVIKVEALDGDLLPTLGGQSKSGELSGKFMHFNRNKRSLVLDLKHDHPVEGKIVDMQFPNRLSAGGRKDYRPPPVLGGDSVAILREIGYGSDDIDEMISSKVTIDGCRSGRQQ